MQHIVLILDNLTIVLVIHFKITVGGYISSTADILHLLKAEGCEQ